MSSILSNIGNVLGSQTFIEKFFQNAVDTGVGQIKTNQEVSEINAETEKLKAESELIKQKNLQNQLGGNKQTFVIAGSIIAVLAIGTAIFIYYKK